MIEIHERFEKRRRKGERYRDEAHQLRDEADLQATTTSSPVTATTSR